MDDWLVAVATGAGLPVEPSTGVIVQDPSGAIVAATTAAESVLGLTRDQLLGRTSADPRWVAVDGRGDILPQEDHPAMQVIRGRGAVSDFLMGVHRPTTDAAGEHIWLTVTSVPAPALVDIPVGSALTVFQPVEQARSAQLRLLDSERKYRLLAEHSSDMVAWMAPDSTILWVSPATRVVLGYEPDQLVGTRALDLVHPDDLAQARAVREALTSQDQSAPALVVMRQRHADGSWRWIESTARAIRQNGVVTGLCTSRRDVTARVEAERERDVAIATFRLAMQHAPVGMALLNADGQATQVNAALCRITGRPAADLIGQRLAAVSAAPTGQSPNSPPSPPRNDERCFGHLNGTTVWALCSVVPLPSGNPDAHALLQVQDVTAQHVEHERLAAAACTDLLTGLSNRAALTDRLTALERGHHREQIGVIFADLNGFKAVNDTWGHQVGDQLLQLVGQRLVAAVRTTDLVARLGGDEFVVLCDNIDTHEALDHLAERVQKAIAQPVTIDDHILDLSVSVGTTFGSSSEAATLIPQADRAMYLAKRAAHTRTAAVGERVGYKASRAGPIRVDVAPD